MDIKNMLLGYVEDDIDNGCTTTDETSKIGGLPDYLSDIDPSEFRCICDLCGSAQPLIVQIFAPLAEFKNQRRTLYVFACIQKSCWSKPESWTCLRMQNVVRTATSESVGNDSCAESSAWCQDESSWEEGTNGDENLTLRLSNLSVGKLNGESSANHAEEKVANGTAIKTGKLKSAVSNTPYTTLESYYLYVETEYDSENEGEDCKNQYNQVLEDVDAGLEESYENSLPLHGDAIFHNYVWQIKKNPGQVIRYCRNNEAPLHLRDTSIKPPKCRYCTGEMIFEFQILSTLIPLLKIKNSTKGESHSIIDFGSAYIYTCLGSCWNAGDVAREELVFLQNEDEINIP